MFETAIILSPVILFACIAILFMRNETATERACARAKRNLAAKRERDEARAYAERNPSRYHPSQLDTWRNR